MSWPPLRDDADESGIDDACEDPSIPAASERDLVAMTVETATAGTLLLNGRVHARS